MWENKQSRTSGSAVFGVNVSASAISHCGLYTMSRILLANIYTKHPHTDSKRSKEDDIILRNHAKDTSLNGWVMKAPKFKGVG